MGGEQIADGLSREGVYVRVDDDQLATVESSVRSSVESGRKKNSKLFGIFGGLQF